jgi:deoxyribonuclease-4
VLFGAHCNGGIKGAVDRAAEIGADAVQLFAQSPRTWHFPVHAEEDLARFRERRAETGIQNVLVHALYLCNLATPDETMYGKSIDTMRATMDAACAIEADGVVFHVGSHLGTGFEAGLARCVPALEQVLDRCSGATWLLLENSAGTGNTMGRSLDELAALVDALGGHPRLGVCLDSCHLLASGFEIRTAEALGTVLDECVQLVGIERLGSLHLNDSQTPLGSNRDRHADIAEGELGADGCAVFLSEPRFDGLPCVMETPGPDKRGPSPEQVKLAKDLRKRGLAKRRRAAARAA